VQVAVIMFYIALSAKSGGTAPVLRDLHESVRAADYMNPLPHTLMLTAIVVGKPFDGVSSCPRPVSVPRVPIGRIGGTIETGDA